MQKFADHYFFCRLKEIQTVQGALPPGVCNFNPLVECKGKLFFLGTTILTFLETTLKVIGAVLIFPTLLFRGLIGFALKDIHGSFTKNIIALSGVFGYADKVFAMVFDHVVDTTFNRYGRIQGERREKIEAELAAQLFCRAYDRVTTPAGVIRTPSQKKTAQDLARWKIRQVTNQGSSVAAFVEEIFLSINRAPSIPPLAPSIPPSLVHPRVRGDDYWPREQKEILFHVGESIIEFLKKTRGFLPSNFFDEFDSLDTAGIQLAIGIFLTYVLSRPELVTTLKDFELHKEGNISIFIGDLVREEVTEQTRETFLRERYLTLLKIFVENYRNKFSNEIRERIEAAAPKEISADLRLIVLSAPARIACGKGDLRLWRFLHKLYERAFSPFTGTALQTNHSPSTGL